MRGNARAASFHGGNGNTATKTGFTFTWNSDDRMTGITGTSSYGYDYQGRRGSKTVGTTTTYLYDGPNLIREAGASTADYLFGPGIDEPLAMSRGGQVYYYGVDGLGSVNLVTNSAGAVQNSYLYDAWGQTRTQTGALANPFTYTAREIGEAGALLYRARYYSPGIGRFLSEDPVRPTIAKYAFVANSPTAYLDPTGELPCPSGCSCAPWRTTSRLLDVGTRDLWVLYEESPIGNDPEHSTACVCLYRRAGILHKWQPYIFSERTVFCPPCTQFQQSEVLYGKPYETEEPIMTGPNAEPQPIVRIAPNLPGSGGCQCKGKL